MTTTNAVTPKMTSASIIDRMSSQFAKVLPKILTPERFCRVVLTAINRNEALAAALADKRNQASVLSAFMRCAEMGLEPDGRRAAITCYKRGNTGLYDVTLIPMYQGLAELAMRSGQISSIHAEKVCENDAFEWENGEIRHRIDFKNERGEAYAYYCIIRYKDGATKTETMSRVEVNAIMARSSAYQSARKYNKSCPWDTDFDEMAKKTVFRRAAKWLPLSPEMRTAIDEDDSDFRPIAASVASASTAQISARQTAQIEAAQAEESPFEAEPAEVQVKAKADEPRQMEMEAEHVKEQE